MIFSIHVWRRCFQLLMVAAVVGLAGCATTLPKPDRVAAESIAIPGRPDTPLGRIVAASTPENQHSGFRLFPLGPFAYEARIQLAQRAQVSLDVQYYHFEGDESGRMFLRALRDAALRGVRVRLLIDDLHTGGLDALFLGFMAHPNIEVRLFNPFCCARSGGPATRFLSAAWDFRRLNHRMHNKMFIADGVAAIIGGRNIGNSYFLRSEMDNFIDMDALAVGQLISPLASLFDRYWNSRPVYPLDSVARTSLSTKEAISYFDKITDPTSTQNLMSLPAMDILGHKPLGEELRDGRLNLLWGYAYTFADYPDKPFEGSVGGDWLETSASYNIIEPMMKARSEVVISSPYFVPGAKGMALLRQLRERGVKVTVLTNSLGATDESLVHIGYSSYREEMLRMGVELFEISGARVKRNKKMFHFGESLGRLHSKLLVIDQQISFVGSMNFDPRSATINTELGAVIDSKPLALELLQVIDLDRINSAWQVRLAASGRGLEWVDSDDDGKQLILTSEPDRSWGVRLKLWLLSPLVSEDQL